MYTSENRNTVENSSPLCCGLPKMVPPGETDPNPMATGMPSTAALSGGVMPACLRK